MALSQENGSCVSGLVMESLWSPYNDDDMMMISKGKGFRNLFTVKPLRRIAQKFIEVAESSMRTVDCSESVSCSTEGQKSVSHLQKGHWLENVGEITCSLQTKGKVLITRICRAFCLECTRVPKSGRQTGIGWTREAASPLCRKLWKWVSPSRAGNSGRKPRQQRKDPPF